MKKRTWHILAGLPLLAASAAQAQFNYTTNNGTITIIGYTGSGGAVVIPNAINGLPVTAIGDNAFALTSLTSVTIPDSVTSIWDEAFYQCSLTNVTIPDSVTSIGDQAFAWCESLTSATIGKGVTNIALATLVELADGGIPFPTLGDEVFGADFVLTNITVAAQNPDYSSLNGVLFDKNQTTLLQYPPGLSGAYTVPATVTSIGQDAFNLCDLTNVTIGDSVTNIRGGAFAFIAFNGFTSVTIPASVTSIGDYAFFQCVFLTNFLFEGNAPAVNWTAFSDLDELYWGSPPYYAATAYYLPGTTGWDAFSTNTDWDGTNSGLPTVVWNLLIQTGNGSFGVRNNQFGFNITGTANIPVAVEVCTNLANPVWSPLQTITLTNGSAYFSELLQTNVPARFYRLGFP